MRLPISFSMRQTVVSVTTSSTVLVATNPNRKYLALMNIGTADVTMSFDGTAAVAGSGWVLAAANAAGSAGGGITWEASGVPIQSVNGIVATGTSNIAVLEGF